MTNEKNALIFSAGDLHIGGALDANRKATGAAALVENTAATIEALGNVNIQAATLRNINGGVTTMEGSTQSQHVVEFGLQGSPERWKANEVLIAVRTSVNSPLVTGWTSVAGYAPDTNNDDPAPRLLLPSPDYPLAKFAAYYAVSPVKSADSSYQDCTGGDSDCITKPVAGAWYTGSDPIWAAFSVTPPARDLPIGHPLRIDPNAAVGQPGIYKDEDGRRVVTQYFDHPVTQAEIDEGHAYHAAHAQLDAATTRFIHTILGGNVLGLGRLPTRIHSEYNVWDYTVTQSTPALQTSAPAKILAGGNMTLTVGAGTNDMSQILAGGALMVQGGSIKNEAAEAQATTVIAGKAMYAYLHSGSESGRRYRTTAYNPVTPPTTVTLAAARQEGGANLAGAASGQAPAREQAVHAIADTKAAGSVQASQRVNPIVEVPSAMGGTPGLTGTAAHANGPTASTTKTSATAPQSLIVRTGTPNAMVPQASLFKASTDAASRYLVETDPAFANYRNWLSSDYLLGALGHDPATVTKRLGDGFYEQRLIREQVAQLTGYRYLAGAYDDQSQYAALMDAGVTFAKAYQLRPGIALSAAQMAQLTSDIVWLVEQTVTLADGSSQRVLVPQVYVRVKPGDIDGSGALLSADTLRIQNEAGQGDVVNSGTLAGRSLVALTADNVQNLGGRITGASVGVNARTDLANIGGTIDAQNAAVLTAGRDIRIASTTQTGVGPQGSATALDRLAAVYVSNPGGTLVARAGQDVQLVGAVLSNTGEGGLTSVQAGRDIQLDTLKTRSNQDTTWNAKNYQRTSESAEVASTITANGTTVLNAGRDIAVRQGTVDAGTGRLSVQAGHDITIAAGQNTQTYEEARHRKTSGFMSSTTRTTRDKLAYTGAEASSLGGSTVTAVAGHDLTVHGSNVVSDRGTTLVAGHDLAITAATNTSVDSHFKEKKTSGLFSGGGFSVTIGTQQQSMDQQGTTTTAAASTIGSTQGHVILSAGQTYTQRGSDVLAPAGDVSISASKVDILEARETNNSQTETRFKQSGLTLALTSPIISAIETAQQMGQAASRTSSTRMKVLAAANVGMGVNNAVNAVKAGQGTTIDGKDNQIATGNKNLDGTAETRDATAAEKAGGINLSISIGASSSQSKRTQSSDSARGSTVAAGGNVSISASGAGADSDLLLQGAKVKAGHSVSLHADDAIDLLAAKSTAEQHSTNSNKSGSIGISIGTGGFGVTVSASKGRGKADGNDVTWTNTEVGAGQAVHMSSGGDTTLKGAVVKADTVQADVGGNLAIESLQDTSTYASKQQSFSASVTMGAGVSGSFSASNSRVNSDFASVEQQSGIQAGDGGFQVSVKGNTDLKGGAITSSQAAVEHGKNSFDTAGTLTTSDIQNHANYSASSTSVGTSSAGFGHDTGNASSTTTAAISGIAGDRDARTGDAEAGIQKIFDADKVQKDVDAQVQITQTFNQLAPTAAATYADNQAKKLKEQAAVEQDQTKREMLLDEAKKWNVNGEYSIAMNIIISAAGGGMTAAATGATREALSWAADQMRQTQIEDSKKFPGICDSNNFCLDNKSGESAGVNGDNFKLAGGRVDIEELCKDNRCTKGDSADTWKTDDSGIIRLKEYDDSGNRISLAALLEANPQWRSPLGGFQGKSGKFMFLGEYLPGSLLDRIAEAYAGTHDMLNSRTWYLPDGTINPKMTESEKTIGEAKNKFNVLLATPFALSVLLPTEVWTTIGTALRK